jgi:hypothetical protein
MDQSLVSLLARTDVCNIQHAHYRDGYLFVIRDKTSAHSDMAFIKVRLTPQLEQIHKRSYQSRLASPYLVHRKPEKNRRRLPLRRATPVWSDRSVMRTIYQKARELTLEKYIVVGDVSSTALAKTRMAKSVLDSGACSNGCCSTRASTPADPR